MEKVLTFRRVNNTRVFVTQRSFSKRLFDLTFSISVLLLLFPVFVSIMAAIRIVSSGDSIYVQQRLGRGGKVFKCYKFRTMYIDADARLREILATNSSLRLEWKKKQKLKDDPRIFSLGKWLRRTSLDELPQFWNVIKGDLSVVGPRPYMVCQKKELGQLAEKILSVKPGITGLWQTSGRSRTTFQKRIHLDAVYVDKRSFHFDIFLIIKTIPQMFFTKDAY